MASAVKEKRTTPRIHPYIVPCVLIDGDRGLAGYLTDLSSRGGRAACEGDVPEVGHAIDLEFRIGREIEPSRLKAAVKWVRKTARGMRAVGLRFERIPAAERKALETLVAEFRRRVSEIGQA